MLFMQASELLADFSTFQLGLLFSFNCCIHAVSQALFGPVPSGEHGTRSEDTA